MAGTLGTLFVLPRYQGMYQGVFAAGSLLYFYEAGTTTPLNTYSSQDLSSANANPVVADAYGLFGPIYLLDRAYKVVLKTAGGVEVWSQDDVRPYTVPALNRVDPSICDGRLTLTSGTPVTTSDVTAATTVYFTPCKGNKVALYDATYGWDVLSFSELSIALGTDTASRPYDVFAYINAGAVAIERLAWTNDSTRATALTTQDGVLVKSGDPTRRYLGTYRTTSTIGQTEDSYANRLVYNHYNQVERPLRRVDSTDSWTYTTDTYRQANGSALNQVAVMIGVAGPMVDVRLAGQFANSTLPTAGTRGYLAIGEDSTSARAAGCVIAGGDFFVAARRQPAMASLVSAPAAGYHYYAWLERSNADSGVTTWYGDDGNSERTQSGLVGSVRM